MTADQRIDDYLAKLPDDQRAALEHVRSLVRRLAPDAVESMSYGMPVLKQDGRALIWFAGWKEHCAIYPLTDAFLAEHPDELAGFVQTKGSLHFTPQVSLPDSLLEKIVRARLADLEVDA